MEAHMESFKQGNNSETSSEEIDQPEKLANDDNAGTGRLYECNFCKRGFTNAQALGGHMNIHRKDKAKLAKSKQVPAAESSISKKLSDEYMASSYFPPSMSDQTSYYPGFGSHMSYQPLIPTPNPSLFDANSQYTLRMGKNKVDANLSLGIGVTYVEENEENKRVGKIDISSGEEVDLELRLGHKP